MIQTVTDVGVRRSLPAAPRLRAGGAAELPRLASLRSGSAAPLAGLPLTSTHFVDARDEPFPIRDIHLD